MSQVVHSSSAVSLLLGVHAHQPAGNFPEVIADAHQRCYRPFLQTVFEYPQFRFAIHFSGWLLDELTRLYPQDIDLLKQMVARGQAELFGAGEYEPVLAAIPARDRLGQIQTLSHKLAARFGQQPQGAWLTERVWEATVLPALAEAGIRYVTVDDYHFLCAGKTEAELDGFYTSEEDNYTLDLFPISESLRYRLPFSHAHDAIAYLESLADKGQQAAIYFDDIEKFGVWPETYAWVYEKGWLRQFIEGVLANPKIKTETFAGFHARHKTRGIVYLPTTSYSEMNEWTLPAPAARLYADFLHQEADAGRKEQHRPFIRGGIWRNFLARYPEANWMHKRMLALSVRLAATPEACNKPELQEKLYRAQANDAYWHGMFGGLYLPHLRRSVYRSLVALEAALDRLAPPSKNGRFDFDHDGCDEIFLKSPSVQAILRADDGLAAVYEFDSYPLEHNFGDTLRCGDEAYYRKIAAASNQSSSTAQHEGIASAHDRVAFKHEITVADLVPDQHARALFIDYWQPAGGDSQERQLIGNYRAGMIDACGSEFSATFDHAGQPVAVEKCLTVIDNRILVSYRISPAGAQLADGTLEIELNLAMPSCDGAGGRYILGDGSIPCGFGQPLQLDRATRLLLDDNELQGHLSLTTSHPVCIRARPHFTVSQSEAGFEKIMQAAHLCLAWTPADDEIFTLTLEVVPHAGNTPKN